MTDLLTVRDYNALVSVERVKFIKAMFRCADLIVAMQRAQRLSEDFFPETSLHSNLALQCAFR